MKRPIIRTKAGQYTWLQVLTLALSAGGYLLGNTVIVVVMLTLATLFGVLAAMSRLKEAKMIQQQQAARNRRK